MTAARYIGLLITAGLLLNAGGRAQSIVKGPYLLYPGDNTKMNLLWQNDAYSADLVLWGTDSSMTLGSAVSSEYNTDHQHQCVITGLVPGTKYYYQVTVGTHTWIGSFRAAPEAGTTSLKFYAYGDCRTYPVHHNAVAGQIRADYAQAPEAQTVLISMGDLVSYGSSDSIWNAEFFSHTYPDLAGMLRELPYLSAIGNHDLGSPVSLFPKFFPYPYAGGRYYSFDYGPVHFTVIDQYTSYTPGSLQYAWIQEDLAGSGKPWKIAVLHEPGWSAGGGHPNNTTVKTVLEPLFCQYGVDLVLAGHNHYYAHNVVPRTGGGVIHHVTTGGGGAPLYTPDPDYPYVEGAAQAYHYCRITIDDDSLLHFVARSDAGVLLDSFYIDRRPEYLHLRPLSVTLLAGEAVGGDYRSLAYNNTDYFAVNPASARPFTCDWFGSFLCTVPADSVTELTMTYDGKNSRVAVQDLFLYDFYNSTWEAIDQRSIGPVDITSRVTVSPAPHFISSSGEIRLRVRAAVPDREFTCLGDFMEATARAPFRRIHEITTPGPGDGRPILTEPQIVPNPAGSQAVLRANLSEPAIISATVYSLLGKPVLVITPYTRFDPGMMELGFDVSSLPGGVYLVEVTGTLHFVSKLIVNREE